MFKSVDAFRSTASAFARFGISDDPTRTYKRVFIVTPFGEVHAEFQPAECGEYIKWGAAGGAAGAGVGAATVVLTSVMDGARVTADVLLAPIGLGGVAGLAMGVGAATIRHLRVVLGSSKSEPTSAAA